MYYSLLILCFMECVFLSHLGLHQAWHLKCMACTVLLLAWVWFHVLPAVQPWVLSLICFSCLICKVGIIL